MNRAFALACMACMAGLLLAALLPAAAVMAQDDPPKQPAPAEMPKEGMLKWAFTEGMTLHFVFNTQHASITTMRGTTEGAVLRLVAALGTDDETISAAAAELLKKGGKPVLEVLEEYVTHEAKAHERKKIAPIIEHLKGNLEPTEKMPDRFIVAEREGKTQCAIDWEVTKARGPRASVHVQTRHIAVRAKQKTLGMEDYEHGTFQTGQTQIGPDGQPVVMTEPDSPVVAMFYHAMELDYVFTIDLNVKEVTDFHYNQELAERERIQFGLKDPLQIAPSFRRLPGRVTKVGEKWEVAFEYFAGGSTRVHVCTYELKEIALRQQRRCARMPWEERIYDRPARAPFPGTPLGGGEGEFWIDIDNNVLVYHSQEIAFENKTTLEIPKKDAKEETREMDTFFNNVLKIEMRLNRITQKQPTDDR